MYESLVISLILKNRSISRAKLIFPISESIKLSKSSHTVYRGFGRTDWQLLVEPKEFESKLEHLKKYPEEHTSYIVLNPYKIFQWPTPHRWPTIQHITDEKKEIILYGELEGDAWFGDNRKTPLA